MLQEEVTALSGQRERRLRAGQLGGFPLIAEIRPSLGKTSVSITLDGAPGVSISMPARDLGKADPGTLVTRLEHRLHHLEDRKASVLADASHAHREIDHARESIGKAFPQAAELAQARERAREIDEQLAKMAAPPQADTQPGAQPAPVEPEGQQWFERSRGLESREALRPRSAPQAEPQDTASPARAPDAGYDGRSWQPRDQEARRPSDVQPDAEPAPAEPAERLRPWWERTQGFEPGGPEPRSAGEAASPAGPEADHGWHPREMPDVRQAETPPAAAAEPEGQQWFERARGGPDPGRCGTHPGRDAAPSASPGSDHTWYPGTAPQMRYEPERDWEAGS